jgi:hypothetical protein
VINLVVTCTKRKTRAAIPSLTLGSVRGDTVEVRAEEWLKRLRSCHAERLPVEALYAGDHWSVVRSLASDRTRGSRVVRIWVCSAGYGLLSWTSRVSPYAATFAPGEADSVCRQGRGAGVAAANRSWWRLLSGWAGPEPGTPRSLAGLARSAPEAPLLVAASAVHLQTLLGDLAEARRELADPGQLALLSAGAEGASNLGEHLLPCDARLQRGVGGARASLNVRLARLALRELDGAKPTLSVLRALFSRLQDGRPGSVSATRVPLTDEEVKRYIRAALRKRPGQRATPLLRCLRDDGRACEQTRFAALFREVREQLHGP